ncbi:Crp/Fnr family transcriptional regulator [Flavobacterium sp.]|jgi:CRP/FNR family transcriptional regulator|uniref:Crp/Fnr family transcriptional regulator n=1 Tax=Flavobacterium sp. TaxID=239 RepID=UPI0037BFA20B
MKELLTQIYSAVFEEKLIEELALVSTLHQFEAGDIIIDFGNPIKQMPLLVNGAVKILREDFEEGELLLYFIEKGDTCAITLTSCINQTKSEIRATAETNVQLVMIPLENMQQWLGNYLSWRDFIFNSYNNRLKEMLSAIDNLAFMNMEERLLHYLIDKAKINHSREINSTHQEIAYDLHSSRVVISRMLKVLENKGSLQLHHGSITLTSRK